MEVEYMICKGCQCKRHIVDEFLVYKGVRRRTCIKCKALRDKRREGYNERRRKKYVDNKVVILERNRQWREDNKEECRNREKVRGRAYRATLEDIGGKI
eukprot:Pgem_evm2s8721